MSSDDVSVSFGADTRDLRSELAVARAQVDGFSAEVRKLAKEAAAAGGAANDNLSNALKNAAASAAAAQREVNRLAEAVKHHGGSLDDNSRAAGLNRMQMMETVHVVKALADELAAGQSPMRALAMEGGRIAEIFAMGNGGVGGTLKAMAESLASVVTPARIMGGAVVGALVGIAAEASKAADAIKELGHIQERIGMDASRILAISAATAGGGLSRNETVKALEAANRQFEQFSTGGGEVMETLKRIGADFVQDAQLAHNFSEWLAAIGNGLRTLDDSAARDIAAKVFGNAEDGRIFLQQINEGKLSIEALDESAKKSGTTILDGPAAAVERMSNEISAAAEKADQELLVAFGNWAHPLLEAESILIRIKSWIAEAAIAAQGLVKDLSVAAQGESIDAYEKRLGLQDKQNNLPEWKPLGNSGGKSWNDLRNDWLQSGAPDLQPIPQKKPRGGAGHHARDGGAGNAGDAVTAARSETDGEIGELRRGLASKMALFAEEAKLKLISEDQRIASVRAAIDEEYAAEKALLQRELALEGQKPQQRQAVLNKMKQLEDKHGEDLQRLSFRAAEEAVRPWHAMVDQMSSSLSSSITGMVEGTKRFSDAIRDMARAVMRQFVQMGVGAVAEWAKGIATQVALTLAGEQAMTAAKGAGVAERLGLEQGAALASVAAKAASIVKSIMASAAEAGAGVTGFLAPIMGPAAVPIGMATQAAVAGLASFAQFEAGAWSIPREGLAILHPGEGVLTAAQNSKIHSFLDNVGGGAGGNTFHVAPQVHFNVTAADSRDVARWLNGSGREVMKTIERQVRMGTHLGLKGFGS